MNFAKFADYCEPFVVNSSLNTNSEDKSQIARLNLDTDFVPNVSVSDILQFIKTCEAIQRQTSILLMEVERILKDMIAVQFERYSGDKYWHQSARWFQRNFKNAQRNFYTEVVNIIQNQSPHYILNGNETAGEIVYNLLSFTELSQIYYFFAGYQPKEKISRYFGCLKPDNFSSGVKILAKYVRNFDYHVKSSYRTIPSIQHRIDSVQMLYPCVNYPLDFCYFYGRISFLVYITSKFSDIDCKNARERIKCLLQDIPLAAADYLGFVPNWQTEPLWKSI
ncbi:MAG: Abi family protein [Bacteroidales bacterium]|nr:Abi family protein [Bacteroidales bacterium]